jgi:hypothetical protein
MSKPKSIRLYPVPGVHALPWPSVEFDATPDEWADIQQHIPPPFTDKPPGTTPDTNPTEAPRGASPDSPED